MLESIRNGAINAEFRRKRERDQIREDKIMHFTKELKTNPSMTTAVFLEAMASKEMLPGSGKRLM